MKGRPPVPTKLKLLKGTGQKCRMNPDEPQPPTEIPQPPTHLSPDARKEWKRITPLLKELGIISEIDMTSLAMYCQSWGEHVKAEREIKKTGGQVIAEKDEEGKILRLAKNPWLSVSKDARLLAHKFLVEFGLTPASRSRVSGKKKAEPEKKKRLDFL